MTPAQIQLVKDSWSQILPMRETAAELFYARLFETHPDLQAYFSGDMREQGHKLMSMLDTAVNGLDDLDDLAGVLQQSGRSHAAYGIKTEDYRKVGDALLWTLDQGLGDAFTAETRAAWAQVYATLSRTMIADAY